ncbi:hypothetical protein [Halapricum desulfuricans]|uniref:Uncharacterized protein n=1 Tax=Halapricum desulfuricans TaxID=2841257 RepID=A0A897N0Y9_9EURY|nr:hypothetical protein [Halapricum desulfuricans]QSG06367.1 hypothetical protein HSR121_2035 [Halapricum desulfuricans]
MSYIRFTQERKYSDGNADAYVYNSGHNIISASGAIPIADWVEVMAAVIERLDLPDDRKEETISAIVSFYLDN